MKSKLTLSSISRVIALPENENSYEMEITHDLCKLVDGKRICIISLLSNTLLQSIDDGQMLGRLRESMLLYCETRQHLNRLVYSRYPAAI